MLGSDKRATAPAAATTVAEIAAARPPSSLTVHAAALVAALAVHAAVAGIVWRYGEALAAIRDRPVEIEVRDLPPPELRPEPPPPPPPPEPARPKVVARRQAPREPQPPVPPQAPPPPNQEPPPEAPKNAPPVFGITQSSVVTGESSVAVPVGTTTMTKDRLARPAMPPQPYAGGDPGTSFQPVPDVYVAVKPRVLHEVNSADIYPPDARSLGTEGTVILSVGLDERGKVVQVRVIERAGHGFDEAAAKAMWKFRFSPALTSDGRAVPYRLTFRYSFELGN